MKWISVKERLPEIDRVLGVIPSRGNYVTEVYFYKNTWYYPEDYLGLSTFEPIDCNVTHWMPLPEPPTE